MPAPETLYALTTGSYSDFGIYDHLLGPPGLDIKTLAEQFLTPWEQNWLRYCRAMNRDSKKTYEDERQRLIDDAHGQGLTGDHPGALLLSWLEQRHGCRRAEVQEVNLDDLPP